MDFYSAAELSHKEPAFPGEVIIGMVSVFGNPVSFIYSIVNQSSCYPLQISLVLESFNVLLHGLNILIQPCSQLLYEDRSRMLDIVQDFQFDVGEITFIHENPIDENLILYHGCNLVIPVISLTVIPACLVVATLSEDSYRESFFKERSWIHPPEALRRTRARMTEKEKDCGGYFLCRSQ